MRFYTVHDDGEAGPSAQLLLLREGFSWPAMLLGPLWALWHGMWAVAILMTVLSFALATALTLFGFAQPAATLAQFGLNILFALVAQDLRRWRLRRKGFQTVDVVTGADVDTALRRFLDRRPDIATRMVS